MCYYRKQDASRRGIKVAHAGGGTDASTQVCINTDDRVDAKEPAEAAYSASGAGVTASPGK